MVALFLLVSLAACVDENEIPEGAYFYVRFDTTDVEISESHRPADLREYLEGYGFIEDKNREADFFIYPDRSDSIEYFAVGFIPASSIPEMLDDEYGIYYCRWSKPEWLEDK